MTPEDRPRAPHRLSPAHGSRRRRALQTALAELPLLRLVGAFAVAWLAAAALLWQSERHAPEPVLGSFGDALYWTVAAFSTAGIAETPTWWPSQLIGAAWIVVGSIVFFGAIVAAVTGFLMRPMQRPVHRIVDTIEYNLERLDELSVDELALLQHTTDTLIRHVEALHARAATGGGER